MQSIILFEQPFNPNPPGLFWSLEAMGGGGEKQEDTTDASGLSQA